jgi:hypothetical protein
MTATYKSFDKVMPKIAEVLMSGDLNFKDPLWNSRRRSENEIRFAEIPDEKNLIVIGPKSPRNINYLSTCHRQYAILTLF